MQYGQKKKVDVNNLCINLKQIRKTDRQDFNECGKAKS